MTEEKAMTFSAFAKSLEAGEDFFVTAEFSRRTDEGIGTVPVITESPGDRSAATHDRLYAYKGHLAKRGGRN